MSSIRRNNPLASAQTPPGISAGGLLNTRQAAELLNLGVVTLEKYRIAGRGPAFLKIGKSVRYAVEDINAWLAEHRCTSTAEATR